MEWLYSFYKKTRFSLIASVFLASSSVFAESKVDPSPVEFKKDKIILAGKVIKVELALTENERNHGLMFREEIKDEDGMLFIFNNEQSLSFWMKNTFIDLAIGYFDQNKTLVDIQEMKAMNSVLTESLPSYTSAKPAMYALEMKKGWFTKNKVKVGAKFAFHKSRSIVKTR